MQIQLLTVIFSLVLLVKLSIAEQALPMVKYMSDGQSYAEAINSRTAHNTLEKSNLLLLEKLATFYHHEYATLSRIQHFMDEGKPVCIANKIQTSQRADKYLFSQPVNLHLAHRLYQLANQPAPPANVLNDQGEITSLNALFTSLPERTLLIPFHRSFGEMLDKQIALLPNQNKLIYQGGDLHNSELNMFIKHRGDFILTYPITIYANNEITKHLNMRNYAIENAPKYIISRVMCANTPETQKHIEKINKVLDILYTQPELLEAHLNWLPKSDHQLIKKYYQEITQDFLH